jgi:hypothetical protein
MLSMDFNPVGVNKDKDNKNINFQKAHDKRSKHNKEDTEVHSGNATDSYEDNNTNISNNNSTNITICENGTDCQAQPVKSTYEITNPLNDTRCKAECWVNCQVHFPDITEQKFCILNVCHCQILDNPNTGVNITITPNNTRIQSLQCKFAFIFSTC